MYDALARQIIFFDAGFVPDFAAGPQLHAWEAVLAPFPAEVRGPSELARVLPRRDGVVRAGAWAWAAATNFLSSLAPCWAMVLLIFVHVHCTLNFAVGTQFHVGAVVFAPYCAQVRGLSGLARVLPRRNGIAQAVVGAWALAVELSGFVGAAPFASLQGL